MKTLALTSMLLAIAALGACGTAQSPPDTCFAIENDPSDRAVCFVDGKAYLDEPLLRFPTWAGKQRLTPEEWEQLTPPTSDFGSGGVGLDIGTEVVPKDCFIAKGVMSGDGCPPPEGTVIINYATSK